MGGGDRSYAENMCRKICRNRTIRKGARRENNALPAMNGTRIPCAGAIVRDGAGRLLLIKRGHDPEAGKWSLPAGRIEPGETNATPWSGRCARRPG